MSEEQTRHALIACMLGRGAPFAPAITAIVSGMRHADPAAPKVDAECAIPMCGCEDSPLVAVCENGHHMHADCLKRMAETLPLHALTCPMCRSTRLARCVIGVVDPIILLPHLRRKMAARKQTLGCIACYALYGNRDPGDA